jgi:hypothetical protein
LKGTICEHKSRKKNLGTPTARDVVTRLIARESSATPAQNAAAVAANVLRSISRDLSRFIGTDGCEALVARARSQARLAHNSPENISGTTQAGRAGNGSTGTAAAPEPQTAEELESTLVALIELLGRLIGDELAMKLADQHAADSGLQQDAVRRRNDE